MALSAVSVIAAIGNLSVSGVTMKDLTEIPQEGGARGAICYPDPNKPISGLSVTRDSFGGAAAKMTAHYTLHFIFLHSPIGSGRGLFDVYADAVAKYLLIYDAILATVNLTGCVDFNIDGGDFASPVADPAGNQFHGCPIAINITEFVN